VVTVRVLQGDCRAVLATLPADSVQACITSPPYFGLRSYGTPPQVWGGDPEHVHDWTMGTTRAITGGLTPKQITSPGSYTAPQEHVPCSCGAWLGELGQEPTPELYVAHLVEVFREVRRVLYPTGCLLLNIGDSYAGSGKGQQGQSGVGGRRVIDGGAMAGDGHKITWPGIKAKDLLMIPAQVALALRADGWWLRGEYVWCLSGGTKVYARTQKGDMPITVKDLARLDPATVKLWNGERWTQLLGLSETPHEDAIEITLRSGERIGCTPHHEWPTQRGLVRADELTLGDVIQTTRLPESEAARRPSGLDDEMIGWFVGLYLAEGWMSDKAIIIASHRKETERYERCQQIAAAFHGSCTWREGRGSNATITVHGRILRAIVETYIGGDSAKTKHLTNACWQRSDAFLRALLDGYLHGDGHYDAKNNRWRLGFTRNYALEADFRTLCARLGIPLRLNLGTANIGPRLYPIHRGELRFARTGHLNQRDNGEVMALGRSRGRKFWHIGVEDEPHLYALASGVLTANSKPAPMPESVTDRCTRAHEMVYHLTKSARYAWFPDQIRETPATTAEQAATKWKGRRNGTDKGQQEGVYHAGQDKAFRNDPHPLGANRRSVWTVSNSGFPDAHFATFPPALAELMVKATTSDRGGCPRCLAPWVPVVERSSSFPTTERVGHPTRYGDTPTMSAKGYGMPSIKTSSTVTGWAPSCRCDAGEPVPQVVLDPFGGAMTTCLAADRLGRDAVGIELNEQYVALGHARLVGDSPLFAQVEVA
jgi:DNA modification methylase